MEQQRLSLYVAMLKHKVYPNYFQFKDHYYSHVRNIDFFEFMASKCNDKENLDKNNTDINKSKEEVKAEATAEQKKYKKMCLCPKYIKSIQ